MNQYFAIQVRTGYESNIASKLISLNENIKTHLGIDEVFIPMEDVVQIDTSAATAKQNSQLSFTGYVFVALEKYTAEVFQFIRSLSEGVYTILSTPISLAELQPFVSEKVELVVEPTETNISTLEKVKAFLSRKGTSTMNQAINSISLTNKSSKRSFFKINKKLFVRIAERLRLTIQNIVQSPYLLIREVIQYEATN